MSDNTQEPTMEEILASIRRIISEDDAPAETEVAPAAVAEPPVAEPVAAPIAELAAEPVAALAEDDDEEPLVLEDEVMELNEPVEEPVEFDIAPRIDDLEVIAPSDAYEPFAAGPPPAYDEPLVSRPQASSVASAFDTLERSVMMPPGGRSLEDVIREMLRPMLKAWLDENLPSIVEAQVAAEVERIARQRR
jgi:cell pole-organizing protein PopZ